MARRRNRRRNEEQPTAEPQTEVSVGAVGASVPANTWELRSVVQRLQFGKVATEEEAEAVVKHGLTLASTAKSARDYQTAMRPLLALIKLQMDMDGVKSGPKHVHQHLHLETPEQQEQRLLAIDSELGIDLLSEED